MEHPAGSRLWEHCGLSRPNEFPDSFGGWTIEIDQCRWGHKARKRTWLYIVGTFDLPTIPAPRAPTHVITSSLRKSDPRRLPNVPSYETHITPIAFARWLIDLAERCRPMRRA